MSLPKSTGSPLTLKEADAVLARANLKASEHDTAIALELYVNAAEAFIHLSRKLGAESSLPLATRADLKARCRDKASQALGRAQQIKAAQQTPMAGPSSGNTHSTALRRSQYTEEEQYAVLDRSSRINGLKFPLWTAIPSESTFLSENLFFDPDGLLALSSEQKRLLSAWKRPSDTLHELPPSMTSSDMTTDDITQHVVTDCSVISALAVCWNHHQRFQSKLGLSAIYPQDTDHMPQLSPNGKYVVRFMANGTHRQIAIDDQLPLDATGRLLCASTTHNIIWPSIIEKAYLKLNGGYDFPGSNSAVDLHAITGWIPEEIDLQSPEVQRGKLWRRLYQGLNAGNCLITLGTGDTVNGLTLVPLHSYAVTELVERDESRNFRVLNPWSATDGAGLPVDHPRSKWMEMDDVCTTFATILVNWRPEIFSFSRSFHGTWKPEGQRGCNHRLRFALKEAVGIRSGKNYPIDVWCLLSRHTSSRDNHPEFINASITKQLEGDQLLREDLLSAQSAYTNSVYTLARTRIDRDGTALLVTVSRDTDMVKGTESPPPMAYTITMYSSEELKIVDQVSEFAYSKTVEVKFSTTTAGGNWNCRTFMNNPQYVLRLQAPVKKPVPGHAFPVRLAVEGSRRVPISAQVVWGGGKRLTEVKQGDIALDTGPYAYGVTAGERRLKSGDYTVVLSTFGSGQTGTFSLTVEASGPVTLEPIPQEGAGAFRKSIKGKWENASAAGSTTFGNYHHNPRYEITLDRPTNFLCRLQAWTQGQGIPATNVSLFKDDSGVADQVMTTGAYAERVCGVASEPQQLEGPATYIAVLSTCEPNVHAEFEFIMYSSACPVTVAAL